MVAAELQHDNMLEYITNVKETIQDAELIKILEEVENFIEAAQKEWDKQVVVDKGEMFFCEKMMMK